MFHSAGVLDDRGGDLSGHVALKYGEGVSAVTAGVHWSIRGETREETVIYGTKVGLFVSL